MPRERLVVGAMTGTSCDGLDLALVRMRGQGLDLQAELLDGLGEAFATPLREELLAVASGAARDALAWTRLRRELATGHIAAVHRLLVGRRADLLAVHGQTVLHRPPCSWQLLDLPLLAAGLDLPVVGDLRAADLAAGGQGAPITPLADLLLVGSTEEHRVVVNLGGFCNLTRLPAGRRPADVTGQDVCSCNQLLDGLARQLLGRPWDAAGERAAAGTADQRCGAALERLLAEQVTSGRSLGSGDELVGQAGRILAGLPVDDALATACTAIARSIVGAVGPTGRVLLAGGGCHNRRLVTELERACAAPVAPCDSVGLSAQWREAQAMAVLGACCQDGLPITLPQVTGLTGPAPLAGLWAFPPAPAQAPAALAGTVAEPDDELPPDRGAVLSEARHPATADLHELDPATLLAVLHRVDDELQPALLVAEPALSAFLTAAAPGFRRGGRLIYVGAGTSGRLGVLDASEAPPTFQVPPGRFIGLIAGGDAALQRSSEGLEDDPLGAVPALQELALGPDDTVLGIAAGGTTPYARGAVSWAAALPRPPLTGFLSCAPCAAPSGCAHLIVAPTGPEALTGSTRLKAGTATKQVLNRLSTALMVLDGRIHGNLMVDLSASNAKLRDRAARIVAELTGRKRVASFALLDAAGGRVKTAVVMHWRGCDRPTAEALLATTAGHLASLESQRSSDDPRFRSRVGHEGREEDEGHEGERACDSGTIHQSTHLEGEPQGSDKPVAE